MMPDETWLTIEQARDYIRVHWHIERTGEWVRKMAVERRLFAYMQPGGGRTSPINIDRASIDQHFRDSMRPGLRN